MSWCFFSKSIPIEILQHNITKTIFLKKNKKGFFYILLATSINKGLRMLHHQNPHQLYAFTASIKRCNFQVPLTPTTSAAFCEASVKWKSSEKNPWSYWVICFNHGKLAKKRLLRETQHTPGAYPRHPQTPKWKEFLHKLLVGGLGYARLGVCW